MPQRFLRPGITTSDAWNSASFAAQSLYVRILTLVDDYGRFDGRVAILHGQCFALRPDINPQETAALRSELQARRLIKIYTVDSKEYLQMSKWQERARGPSRFPAPPQESAGIRSEPLPNPASLAIVPSPSHESSPSHKVAPSAAVLENEVELIRLEVEKKLSTWFKRLPNQIFSYSEQTGIHELSKRPNVLTEIDDVDLFRRKPENYFPKSLQSLVQNWDTTLDRARVHDERQNGNLPQKKSLLQKLADEL